MKALLFLTLLHCSEAFKFLAYNPQYGTSHVKFISSISDALVEAGHDVVVLSPRTDTHCGSPKTKARVIEVNQAPEAAAFEKKLTSNAGVFSKLWKSADPFSQIDAFRPLVDAWTYQCDVLLNDTVLVQQLREEQFDAALTENFDACGYALFHQLGIDKFATVITMALLDGLYSVTHIPANPSYVPTMMGGSAGDRMSFTERLLNTLTHLKMDGFIDDNIDLFQAHFDKTLPEKLNLKGIMMNSSLVFMNSDPLADFPKLSSPRVIDIGGISVHAGHGQLDEYWSDVLNLRNHTIFISFGSFIKSYLMPDVYKQTIRETMKKFPDVTFVWKYEKPEEQISAGIDNLVETTWAPQHELLHDPRLSAFVTHGGQGSITESAGAGVPLICIPVSSDQWRNGRQVERNGVGIMLPKDNLQRMGPLEEAIATILKDKSYKSNAVTLAAMIADRPFSMKEVFVRNMEFMVKYGPLRRFDHYGAQLNSFQYYLIDIFAFLGFLAISALLIVVFALKFVVNQLSRYFTIKKVKKH